MKNKDLVFEITETTIDTVIEQVIDIEVELEAGETAGSTQQTSVDEFGNVTIVNVKFSCPTNVVHIETGTETDLDEDYCDPEECGECGECNCGECSFENLKDKKDEVSMNTLSGFDLLEILQNNPKGVEELEAILIQAKEEQAKEEAIVPKCIFVINPKALI